MEKFKSELLSERTTSMYNYEIIQIKIKLFFEKYRENILKKRLMTYSISDPLGNDNMGIFSSEISNTVHSKVEQIEKINKYIDAMNKHIEILKREFNDDEKVIFQKSIMEELEDEKVSSILSISLRGLYNRKKSCYIKTAIFFNLDVLK